MTIEFNFETKRFEGISLEQVRFWAVCFPDIDVTDQIAFKAASWVDANADRKGRKKKWKAFLRNWLARAQRDAAFLKQIGGGHHVYGSQSGDRGNL